MLSEEQVRELYHIRDRVAVAIVNLLTEGHITEAIDFGNRLKQSLTVPPTFKDFIDLSDEVFEYMDKNIRRTNMYL